MMPIARIIRADGAELIAVPSAHQSFPFAQLVNQLCSDPATRPDAIAVELPASAARAASAWLSEIGVERGVTLPCMLGLARAGQDNASLSIVYLTPTDSIVEAIRCGLELGVPVDGVDLDAGRPRTDVPILIPDPLQAGHGAANFIHDNAAYAAHCRDATVDDARERAMAKRLALMMAAHRRVLFVCGLAHWEPLRQLLEDESNAGGSIDHEPGEDACPAFLRVIVYPTVALPHMDRFPAIVNAYERARRPATDSAPRTCGGVDVVGLFAHIMRATDVAHFSSRDTPGRLAHDWEARTKLEEFLGRLCIVGQRRVPDAATILTAAAGIMSAGYRRQLASQVLTYPWATPKQFPALPLLVPSGVGSSSGVTLIDPRGKRGPVLRLARDSGGDTWIDTEFGDWEWTDDRIEASPPADMVLNWPPIDRLFTAMSLQAVERARVLLDAPRVDRFSGSLRDGLATKRTLRLYAEGRDDIFVRIQRRRHKKDPRGQLRWDPVVWLFSLQPDARAHWRALSEPFEELIPHARNPDAMRDRARELGDVLVEQIAFGTQTYGSSTPVRGGHSKYEWLGVLAYIPTHFTLRSTSRFVEDRQFRTSPILSYRNPTAESAQRLRPSHPLLTFFQTTYGLMLDLEDWPTSLIRMAIPFARQAVTVVAPDFFSLPQVATSEAATRGVDLKLLPHSMFPRENLDIMSTWYGAYPVAGTSGREFSPAVERRFGESASANSHLLPRDWLSYGDAMSRERG